MISELKAMKKQVQAGGSEVQAILSYIARLRPAWATLRPCLKNYCSLLKIRHKQEFKANYLKTTCSLDVSPACENTFQYTCLLFSLICYRDLFQLRAYGG